MTCGQEIAPYEGFCKQHEINVGDICDIISRFKAKISGATVEFDCRKYQAFGILKLNFIAKGLNMLPMLFGTPANLSRLAHFLWSESSRTWTDEMSDLTNRGTYLKRRVLIPAIMKIVECHYRLGARILDVGCGEGVLTKELINKYPSVHGFDSVGPFIDRLKSEFPSLATYFSISDLLADNLISSFDIVVASALLLVLPDVDRGLSQLFSLAAQGGIIIIADVCSRLHRSLGYYKGDALIQVHDVERVHHFEKDVGGGGTVAIHNHHPPGYYRKMLEDLGCVCLSDQELLASRQNILGDPMLSPQDKDVLLQRMAPDFVNPTFFLLVMRKNGEA